MGAAMVGHRDEHRGQPPHAAGVHEGFLVGLPDAMHDRRVAGIGGRAVIELAAEIDDLQRVSPFWSSCSAALVRVGCWRLFPRGATRADVAMRTASPRRN